MSDLLTKLEEEKARVDAQAEAIEKQLKPLGITVEVVPTSWRIVYRDKNGNVKQSISKRIKR